MPTSSNSKNNLKTVHDSMGELQIPINALYGAQTQRAINNFTISTYKMPIDFIKALSLVKSAAAKTNLDLKLLEKNHAEAIIYNALNIYNNSDKYLKHFPIDIFQTGSGTSTNMNMNEVIATLCNDYDSHSNLKIHPNDHVNMSQSSNDTIPTTIHVSSSIEVNTKLIPSLEYLEQTILEKAKKLTNIVKTGRTHLMDAMPIRLDQELSTWASQIRNCKDRILMTIPRLNQLPQGGTAIGTGINAHPDFSSKFCENLSDLINKETTLNNHINFLPNPCLFESIATQDTIVELSGQLKTLAVSLMKISNDLRWMNSGPISGLSEITLKALQPGSSIMPGKINPVIPEAVCMVAAKVIGNDSTITVSGQSGNFQLNVMLPIIAFCILESINILSNACLELANKAIACFEVNTENLNSKVDKNPIMITALNPVIGYELGAKIAKQAYAQQKPIKEVALAMTDLSADELDKLLDPKLLTEGGINK